MKDKQRIKVLYIAGIGRSGSTLLARLLGEVPGFFNAGEATHNLLHEKPARLPCGCGADVSDCEFWKSLLPQLEESIRAPGAELLRVRNIPRFMWMTRHTLPDGPLTRLAGEVEKLLSTIQARTGCDVVIDASKNPALGFMLGRLAGLELHVVHLVRDPRGVVSSRKAPKAYLKAMPAWLVLTRWLSFNAFAELLRPMAKQYRLVRYEDLAHQPRKVLQAIVGDLTGEVPELAFLQGQEATIGLQHSLAGNPDKHSAGRVTLKTFPWSLPPMKRWFVSCIAWPLMIRYKYGGQD